LCRVGGGYEGQETHSPRFELSYDIHSGGWDKRRAEKSEDLYRFEESLKEVEGVPVVFKGIFGRYGRWIVTLSGVKL
jgi:hypothetical protein